MIRGIPRNIALSPIPYKDLNPEETFSPYNIDLRNGRLTDAGNWEKRNGSAEWRDTGIDKAIKGLIPLGYGYAINTSGNIFKLTVTPSQLATAMNGGNRPTWDRHNDLIILCDGGDPVKIKNNDSALLDGSPPKALFISRIGNYSIMSSVDQFNWCASGNPENWTTGDSGNDYVKEDGGLIKMQITYDERLYFFKDTNIECWYNRGGTVPFARLNNYSIWDSATKAGYSVVKANNTVYWFDKDGDFKFLNGNQGQVISKFYRWYLDKYLKHPSDVYGFDCRKENCIRWFSPVDGLCLKYDYLKNFFSEDNTWEHGQFERLNWNSYMELNNEQYFGDYDPTGKVYHWSKDYLDDNGKEIRVYRRYKIKLTDNGNRARVNLLRFAIKRGVATVSGWGETLWGTTPWGEGSVSEPKMTFRVRFEDSTDWEPEEVIDLGQIGDIDPYQDFHNLGVGREMEIEIIETDAVEYLLRDILLTSNSMGR